MCHIMDGNLSNVRNKELKEIGSVAELRELIEDVDDNDMRELGSTVPASIRSVFSLSNLVATCRAIFCPPMLDFRHVCCSIDRSFLVSWISAFLSASVDRGTVKNNRVCTDRGSTIDAGAKEAEKKRQQRQQLRKR